MPIVEVIREKTAEAVQNEYDSIKSKSSINAQNESSGKAQNTTDDSEQNRSRKNRQAIESGSKPFNDAIALSSNNKSALGLKARIVSA